MDCSEVIKILRQIINTEIPWVKGFDSKQGKKRIEALEIAIECVKLVEIMERIDSKTEEAKNDEL